MAHASAGDDGPLTPEERAHLSALRSATSLADLVDATGLDDPHEAYFAAKRRHRDLRGRRLAADPPPSDAPGAPTTVDGVAYRVHGVTHADTDAERAHVRGIASTAADEGAAVYCEQGIRSLYLGDVPVACAMDDYRRALRECARLDAESHLSALEHDGVDGLVADLTRVSDRFREATFALVEAGGEVYGDRFRRALGDLATAFTRGHEGAALADDYESFRLTRAAAEDPDRLPALVAYYDRAFLPQPVEREWLRAHDPELELVTHARNERMADYAVFHADADVDAVHLVVGAAHVPGVEYYLRRHRDGDRPLDGFAPL
ncbi:hypothetical protein [Halobaculum sp. EA56]|uniref:hypothetical protein n=1 Tax=Halobaculum sp. EA56 TaxID=3421648 RepID=UPI003EB7848C